MLKKTIGRTALALALMAALAPAAAWAQGQYAVAGDGGRVSLTDTVHYSGLEAGRAYTATVALVDSSTGLALLDASGDPVASAVTFVPRDDFGTVEVVLDFRLAPGSDGVPVSAWESVVSDGVEVLRHPASGEPLVLYLEEPPAPEPEPDPEPVQAAPVPEPDPESQAMAQTGSVSGAGLALAGGAAMAAGALVGRRPSRDARG